MNITWKIFKSYIPCTIHLTDRLYLLLLLSPAFNKRESCRKRGLSRAEPPCVTLCQQGGHKPLAAPELLEWDQWSRGTGYLTYFMFLNSDASVGGCRWLVATVSDNTFLDNEE